MKMRRQTDEQIEEIIAAGDGDLLIVSGEGEIGTEEDYDGEQTVAAIRERLTREMCDGDRWAYIDTYDRDALAGVI